MAVRTIRKKRYSEYAITFLVLFLIIGICIIGRPLESLDELWHYSMGSNMAKGLLPYRDINMVVTPMSGIIGGIALGIFGEQLIVYRVLGTLLCVSCMLLFYDILRIMEIGQRPAFCFCVYISAFYGMSFAYDYNYCVLLILLLIMDLLLRQEIGEKRAEPVRWLVIGSAAGSAVLFKQSTGLAVLAATSVLAWRSGRMDGRKALCYIAGCALPGGLFIGWLLLFHIWEPFWNYAFGGLNSFRQYNRVGLWTFLFHSGPLCTAEAGLAITIVAAGVRKLVQDRGKQAQKKWLAIFILSAAGMAVAYPITDDAHFVIALLPLLILGICELPIARVRQQEIPFRLMAIIAVLGMGISFWSVREKNTVWSELAHYQGIRVDPFIEQMVQEVNAYLRQDPDRPAYILDGTAMLYKIPLGRYDKDYDMCLAGNWGKRTPEEMAQALLRQGGIMLLSAEGYGVNWQVPKEFLEYIKTHASPIGHIGKYDVYIAGEQAVKQLLNE